jgi:hypothetical protein
MKYIGQIGRGRRLPLCTAKQYEKMLMTVQEVRMEDANAVTTIQKRGDELALSFRADHKKYLWLGRANYHSALAIRWLASAAGLLAGILGLAKVLEGPTVGAIAGTGGLLLAFGRDLQLQQKANWHYTRAEAALRFLNRLKFQLPLNPTAEDISTLAKDYDDFNENMTRQWDQRIAHDIEPFSHARPRTESKG